MGWQDRDYNTRGDRPSRLGTMFRRMVGEGDNPLDWAIRLYRAWGITVKIHILFIVMIAAQLILTAPKDAIGFWHMAIGMATLFLIVLLHEYGHCFACRWVKGTADQILMWPLGGLASCQPPPTWRANFITTAGGPMVNVALVPILGAALALVGVPFEALWNFNPFRPAGVIGLLQGTTSAGTYARIALWWAYYMNLVLLGFNVLLPMYPMDGGRLLQALLWRQVGYARSMRIAATVGLVAAGCLFVFSMVGQSPRLMSIAIFGGLICWMEKKRLEFMGEAETPWADRAGAGAGMRGNGGGAGGAGGRGESWIDFDAQREEAEARAKAREQAEADQQELDRLLAKIKAEGMGALTRKEKAWLEGQSQRRRGA